MEKLLRRYTTQRLGCLLLFVATACAPPPARALPTPTIIPTVVPSPTAVLHAPEIRFALIGDVATGNVWALFDSKGYSYNAYALQSAYWPRLYRLSVPDGKFEPAAASGMPSSIEPEGALFTGSVPVRGDLRWTDGAPLTANDVAFTVNTALEFQLGFDWRAYYNPHWLDHAEALNPHTVKLFFKQAPGVGMWQYGALQGPVVQQAYWAPKIKDAAALLPRTDDAHQIAMLTQKVADFQKRVDQLIAEGVTATGVQARDLQLELKRRQGDLDQATNDLSKAQAAFDSAMEAARTALYALGAANEPTLGDWTPASTDAGKLVNQANPAHPFGELHFDRAVYTLYKDEDSAVAALKNGDVNAILEPNGLSPSAQANLSAGIVVSPGTAGHFLVINPVSAKLADPTLRRALMCSISVAALTKPSILFAAPLATFVLPGNAAWINPAATTPCGSPNEPATEFNPAIAVNMLRSAGYTWITEPTGAKAGTGLKGPDGQPVQSIVLLAASEQENAKSVQAAQAVEQTAGYLGIPLSVQPVDSSAIRYAVFNDRQYDMAIMGWRLSEYPGYLCDWFGSGNPFGYQDDQIGQQCQELQSTSDLEAARAEVFQIQARLAQQLPFIPLYSGLTYDAYRGIRYPFSHVLGGLSGSYGAPALAIPTTP